MQIKVKISPQDITETCVDLCKYLKSFDITQKDLSDITLAIDEVLTNIYEHGYSDTEKDNYAYISIWHEQNKIYIKIIDSGKAYDFKTTVITNKSDYLHSNRRGGFGIAIIKKVIDEVYMDRIYNENILTMVKNIDYQSDNCIFLNSDTSNGYLQNGILKVITKKDCSINIEDAKEHFQQYIDLIKESPEKAAFGMIIDTRNMKMISKEAKDYYINQPPLGVKVFAIIINSTFGRWMGNYFISRKKNKTQHLKLFNSEIQAINWIESYRDTQDTIKLINFS